MKGMLKICKIWRLVCLGHWKRQIGVTNDTWFKPLVLLTIPLFNIIWNFYRGIHYMFGYIASKGWKPHLKTHSRWMHLHTAHSGNVAIQLNAQFLWDNVPTTHHHRMDKTKASDWIQWIQTSSQKKKENKFYLNLCLLPKVWPTPPMQI